MHHPRRWLLATIAALALTGLAASSAAPRPVEVEDARTGEACPDVTVDARHTVTGGCMAPFVNETRLTVQERLTHLEVVPDGGCGLEFVAYIGADRTGYLTNQFFSDCLTSCDEPVGAPHPNLEWPIESVSERSGRPGRKTIVVKLCFRAPGVGEGTPGFNCTIAAELIEVGRRQRLTAERERCREARLLELSGRWISDARWDPDEAPLAIVPVRRAQTGR